MNTAAALGAARSLGVDIANLTYRLALTESSLDQLRQVFAIDGVPRVSPDMWQRRNVAVGGPVNVTRTEVVLTEEQAVAIAEIVTTLGELL